MELRVLSDAHDGIQLGHLFLYRQRRNETSAVNLRVEDLTPDENLLKDPVPVRKGKETDDDHRFTLPSSKGSKSKGGSVFGSYFAKSSMRSFFGTSMTNHLDREEREDLERLSQEQKRREHLERDIAAREKSRLAVEPVTMTDEQFHKLLDSLEIRYGRKVARLLIGFLTFAVQGVTEKEVSDMGGMDDERPGYIVPTAFPDIKHSPDMVWIDMREKLQGLVKEVLPKGSTNSLLVWRDDDVKTNAARRYATDERLMVQRTMGVYFCNFDGDGSRASKKISPQPLVYGKKSVWSKASQVNHRRCVEGIHHLVHARSYEDAAREACNFASICAHISTGVGPELLQLFDKLHREIATLQVEHTIPKTFFEEEKTFFPEAFVVRLGHYRRWLRAHLTFITLAPRSNLISSINCEPLVSFVRKDWVELIRLGMHASSTYTQERTVT